jgi:adenine-specific DNA-methyltransferase
VQREFVEKQMKEAQVRYPVSLENQTMLYESGVMTDRNFDRFRALLRELFMFDQADLDFGIYRIMNAKRDEITRFLDRDLLPQVREALGELEQANRFALEADLARAIEQAKALGAEPESLPRVRELRQQIAAKADLEAKESEVFSDLYNFFRRYYDEGDFLSLRRYKQGVYGIPYEGEEVKLHWANADQYYIKTTEYFHDYAFKLSDGRRVHFKLAEADTVQNNNKPTNGHEHRFILREREFIAVDNGELTIRFEYRADREERKQADLNAESARRILQSKEARDWLADLALKVPTEKNPDRTLLDKRLADYTGRNTFDYFIHKDLGGFLRRELDIYIMNEVMHLEDIESDAAPRVEEYLARIRAIRRIAHKTIDFLAQLENFQKKLWLKKKFVIETNYCITLDQVPEELYPEIAANDSQRDEWVQLFAIDEIKKDLARLGYSVPLTADFLKANKHLVVDTKHFDTDLKDRLLHEINDLDKQLDGTLIYSENFQALGILSRRYRNSIPCVYIDPPYNTGGSEILYKNEYVSSSWLTLMENRLAASVVLLSEDPVVFIAIDDFEMVDLCELIDTHFNSLRREMIIVNHHPQGGKAKTLANTHEYMLACVAKSADRTLVGRLSDQGVEYRPFKRSGTAESNFRYGRPNSFYAILVEPKTKEIVGAEPPPEIGAQYPIEATKEGFLRIYPLGEQREERVWRRSYESGLTLITEKRLKCSENLTIYQIIEAHDRSPALFSNWVDPRYNAGTFGANLLRDIIGKQNPFSYPKSIHTVEDAIFSGDLEQGDTCLDFFAGSGTTGHAVINLNREDDGRRKYILVEMGEYFDTVLLPRIKKVVYSEDWKDGQPVSRKGISQMFKYLRLESYEDSLNNLELKRTPEQGDLLGRHAGMREDYVLRYMLDVESQGSASLLDLGRFEDPFHYTLNIATDYAGETKPTNVDLVETFNWLLGLRVSHIDAIRGFRVVQGTNPIGEKVLVIWRKTREKKNSDLDEFFLKQGYNTRDMEFDLIYVNGDNNLENLKRPDETWKVRLIEEEFKRLMFDVENV